jgi:hypothetical protein
LHTLLRLQILSPRRGSVARSTILQVSSERGYPVQNLMPVAWRAEGPILPQALSDIPEISFFREGCPDREPGDLVAGLFDGALDLLLLGLPSFE